MQPTAFAHLASIQHVQQPLLLLAGGQAAHSPADQRGDEAQRLALATTAQQKVARVLQCTGTQLAARHQGRRRRSSMKGQLVQQGWLLQRRLQLRHRQQPQAANGSCPAALPGGQWS